MNGFERWNHGSRTGGNGLPTLQPQVRQDHTGNCPKCGMTLEPVLPSLMDEANPELADFTRRFWWTLPVTKRVGEGLTLVVSTIAAQAGQAGQGTDRTWHRRHGSQAAKQAEKALQPGDRKVVVSAGCMRLR